MGMDVEASPSRMHGGGSSSSHAEAGSLSSIMCFSLQLCGELWRRIKMEITVELPMLKQRWKLIFFGIVMQYVHGMFTQLAHRMHQPQEQPLHDMGFELTPELGPELHWVSETIFGTMFALFVVWTFTPFLLQRKRFYTAVLWSRLLMVLVVCQALRIVTFTATQLPGPSFHCRASETTARRPWPDHWSGHLVVDVSRQVSKSCGDLIFSSHTIFMLTGILAYTEFGSHLWMKYLAWAAGAVVSFLIVASRKHYTVDIVIAWYTVPLVFYSLHRRWTTRRPMSEFLQSMGETDEPSERSEVTPLLEGLQQVTVEKANDGSMVPLMGNGMLTSSNGPTAAGSPADLSMKIGNSAQTANGSAAGDKSDVPYAHGLARPRSQMSIMHDYSSGASHHDREHHGSTSASEQGALGGLMSGGQRQLAQLTGSNCRVS